MNNNNNNRFYMMSRSIKGYLFWERLLSNFNPVSCSKISTKLLIITVEIFIKVVKRSYWYRIHKALFFRDYYMLGEKSEEAVRAFRVNFFGITHSYLLLLTSLFRSTMCIQTWSLYSNGKRERESLKLHFKNCLLNCLQKTMHLRKWTLPCLKQLVKINNQAIF